MNKICASGIILKYLHLSHNIVIILTCLSRVTSAGDKARVVGASMGADDLAALRFSLLSAGLEAAGPSLGVSNDVADILSPYN